MHFATSSLCPLLSYPLKSENFTNPRNRLHPAAILLQPCSRLGFRRPHGVLFFKSSKAIRFHTFFCPKRASTRNPVPTACQDDNKNRSPVGRVCVRVRTATHLYTAGNTSGLLKKKYSRDRRNLWAVGCVCVFGRGGEEKTAAGEIFCEAFEGEKRAGTEVVRWHFKFSCF